jgi:hypothetical protein
MSKFRVEVTNKETGQKSTYHTNEWSDATRFANYYRRLPRYKVKLRYILGDELLTLKDQSKWK